MYRVHFIWSEPFFVFSKFLNIACTAYTSYILY